MTRIKIISIIIVIALFSSVINYSPPLRVSAETTGKNTVNWTGAVPQGKIWTITYASPVNVLSANTNTFKVFDASNVEQSVIISVGIDGLTVRVKPVTPYAAGNYSLKTYAGLKSTSGTDISNGLTINFTVTAEAEPDGITVTPYGTELAPGGSCSFSAALDGVITRGSFTWSMSSQNAIQTNCGNISPQGDYLAPLSPGVYYVIAQSVEYPGLRKTASINVVQLPQSPVDFMIGDADITHPANAVSGSYLYIKVRVHNQTPSNAKAGGSVVRFTLNGRTLNEVPFYLGAGEQYKDVSMHCLIPEGDFSYLTTRDTAVVVVTAEVDPNNSISETNENNNTASSEFNVKGKHDIQLHDTDPMLSVDASGLSAWSTKDDAADNMIAAALPGQHMSLKARIKYAGGDNSEDVNVKFIINGIVIKDDNRKIYRTSSGYTEVTGEYYVPFNISGPIDFKVLLSNGSEASITIPYIQWDVGIGAGDMRWSSETVAVPGKYIYLTAVLKNYAALKFLYNNVGIAFRVLIDGHEYFEREYFYAYNESYPTIPAFLVPAGRTEPIVFTVITDPYDQLTEHDETNNIASITIPLVNDGTTGPDLSIDQSNLSYIAHPLVPGSHVELYAAIKNNAKTFPTKNLRVLFKINGVTVANFEVAHDLLKPLQYRSVSRTWTVPADMTGEPVFEVVLDPEGKQTGDDISDNTASLKMEMAEPDLELSGDCLSWSPDSPQAGKKVNLTAIVRNNGMTPALNSSVRFMLDGATVGEVTVPTVPGASASSVSFEWQIPVSSDLSSALPWDRLEGFSGKIALPAGISRDYVLQVTADPDNLIAESNEDNNISAEKTLTVNMPYEKKIIYVKASDVLGLVPAAEVAIKASDGKTATALTGEDGWCAFTGVPSGSYTITIKKEGYNDFTNTAIAGDAYLAYYRQFSLERKSGLVAFSDKDTDGDLLSDDIELLYGSDKNNPDTDGDGVIDGKDLSPLMDPAEPSFLYLQKKGMIRIDQPICAYGLNGWVDIYDMEFSVSDWADKLEYSHTEESEGTRTSDMTQETYKRAMEKIYEAEKYKAWDIKNILPIDVHYADTELRHDMEAEDSYIFPADHFHRTEYRFYYDYLTDYQIVYMKNTEEVLYPSDEEFFSYLLTPIKIRPNAMNSYSFQFTQGGLTDQIYRNDDNNYKELAFQYAFYKSDNFDDDTNLAYAPGFALADNDGSDLFTFKITLPSESATLPSGYMKITPVWISNTNGNEDMKPAIMSWNLTGITREIVYAQDATGNSKSLKEQFKNLAGLNTDVMTYQSAQTFSTSSKGMTKESWAGIASYDPNGAENEKYVLCEMTLKILSYVDKGVGGVNKAFSGVEKIVLKVNKKKDLENLDDTHWIKQPKYGTLLAGFAIAQGVVTIYSDGVEAWKAYQEGDGITCVYYSAKAAVTVGDTAASLATISKNIVAWSGKSGRFAKLATDEAAVGLAIAAGVVEMSYNAAMWATTDDPITKAAYGEAVFESAIDTIAAVVAIVYAPFIAFQATWMVLIEVYGFFAGNDLAYRVASSPSTAIVFIFNYWTEGVPSEIAEDAYTDVRDYLIEQIKGMNQFGKPFFAVFIDPQI